MLKITIITAIKKKRNEIFKIFSINSIRNWYKAYL